MDDTLAFIEKAGAQCKWVRLEASSGTRKDVFTFDGPCEAAQLAWSHDGRKGAVLVRAEEARPGRAWTVDLGTGQGTALPLPEVGLTTELGFDPQGQPVALSAHYERPGLTPPERVEENGQAAFVFEGQKYPILLQDGTVGLAHAWRREGTAWKRVETRVASYEWDLADETSGLELAKKMGPNTVIAAGKAPESERVSEEQAAALDASVSAKSPGTGEWGRLNTAGGPVYHWQEQVEYLVPATPVRWEVGGKLVEPEQLALPDGSELSLATRGNILLLASRDTLRLYDVKQKKLLRSLTGVYQPHLWPRPEAASGKPAAPAPAPASAPVAALSMKLDNPQTALEFLSQSAVKLEEGQGDCSYLTEYGTLAKLVEKVRKGATQSSVRCEPKAGTKAWACKADFKGRMGEGSAAADFSLGLQYSVDDATRTLEPGSLVCNMAG
jgi:hypothetical protein